jgi:hypothetical protein
MNYRLPITSKPLNLTSLQDPLIIPAPIQDRSLLVQTSLPQDTRVGDGGRIIVNVKFDPNTIRYQYVHEASMDDMHHGKLSYRFDSVIPIPANHTVDLYADGFAKCHFEWV